MCAQDRSKWRQLVETAMLTDGALLDDDDEATNVCSLMLSMYS